ncbi:uncharacterized protein LOC136091669 [Hydra vulgaris]|uniref:Uncharacterized protein LOC136091669 n=1 Tax=Hydra vulgaris TaxID=6087 RepID=A0ABM4DLM9_HYDVU
MTFLMWSSNTLIEPEGGLYKAWIIIFLKLGCLFLNSLTISLNLKSAIISLCANEDIFSSNTISASQWKSIEGGVEILAPLKEATETWSVESIPTINTVADSLYLIHDKIDQFIETDGKNGYGTSLEALQKISNNKRMVSLNMDNVECQPVARVLSADLSPNSKLKRKLNVRLETQEPTSELNPILSEMCQYEYLPDAKKDFPIFDWWKLHSNTLSELSSLARQILAIPASSTKSERVFSSGGNVVRSSRCNLRPEKIEQIILIRENIVLLEKFDKKILN